MWNIERGGRETAKIGSVGDEAPALLSPVCMINLLGDLWAAGEPRWDRALAFPGVTLHLYGKKTARPGRKMGHLNCIATSPDQALDLAERAFAALTRSAG